MDRFSFGTYLVDEFNQEAFTLCHDIANLKKPSRQPVVLIGDTGTGKTHLLYSIIGRIRTSSARAGIAYVTADDFPEEVRNLIAHPEQVESAPNAVLLVDQVESFKKNLEVLDSIVRLFLDNGHSVICASNIHPARLQNLPDGLSQLLVNGNHFPIVPQDSPTRIALLESIIREEQDEVIARLEEDLAELRTFLTSASESHTTEDVDDDTLLLTLRKELEVTRAELELTKTRLNVTEPESLQTIPSPLSAQYTDSVKELQAEIEQLNAENALNAVSTKEAFGLRKQLEVLEAERDELREQLNQGHTARLENTDEPLVDSESRDEARALVDRAETLVKIMHANRDEFAESQTLHAKQMAEIQELEGIFKRHESSLMDTTSGDSARTELMGQWETAVANAESERDDLAELLGRRQESLDILQQECILLKQNFEDAQHQLAEKTDAIVVLDLALEENEKKKTDELSELNQQISHYEINAAQLKASIDSYKKNDLFVQGDLLKLKTRMGESNDFVDQLLDVYKIEDDDATDTRISDSATATTFLDTIEGAKMLERMDFEEIQIDEKHSQSNNKPVRIPDCAENLKYDLDTLMEEDTKPRESTD
jgi:hypothetical protein